MKRLIKVCYFGTYRQQYSRNRIMIEGLRRNGVEVIECHETLWSGIDDRVQITSGGWLSPKFWLKVFRAYLNLLRKYFRIYDYDVMVVGYPGQFDIFLGRLLSRISGKPLVWDIFMSIYLIALERNLDRKSRLTVAMLRWIESLALRIPDILIQDTSQYVEWFSKNYRIDISRFAIVPTGADDRVFFPRSTIIPNKDTCKILYYGTFIPNHGVGNIITAANLLRENKDLQFIMIGTGPDLSEAVAMSQDYDLDNIQFIGWLELRELTNKIQGADICLGAFGDTPQSQMTIQNKIFECLAMKKPVITGDSPAVRAALTHLIDIYLCKRVDAASLAAAIQELYTNRTLRKTIAEFGYQNFLRSYTTDKIGLQFETHLSRLLLNGE